MDATAIAEQPLTVRTLDGEQIQAIWNAHLQAFTPLTHMLITGIWHDPGGTHEQLWTDVLQRLVGAGTAPLTSVTSGLGRRPPLARPNSDHCHRSR
jgi:hypothetical protein